MGCKSCYSEVEWKIGWGQRIGVQKAKYLDRSTKRVGQGSSYAGKRKEMVDKSAAVKGSGFHQRNEMVWIAKEGDTPVVKLSDMLASSLKKEACNSFIATVNRLQITEKDIYTWIHLG